MRTDIPRKALFFSYSFNISDHSCEQEEEINIKISNGRTYRLLNLRLGLGLVRVYYYWITATRTLNGMCAMNVINMSLAVVITLRSEAQKRGRALERMVLCVVLAVGPFPPNVHLAST